MVRWFPAAFTANVAVTKVPLFAEVNLSICLKSGCPTILSGYPRFVHIPYAVRPYV